MDAIDIREIIALDNADMFEFPVGALNGILDKHPNFLKLAANGSENLTNAKNAFISAYEYLRDVKNALKQESDNQDDDLFVFESEGDEQEFDNSLNILSELVDSLNENRAVTEQYREYNWTVQTDNGDSINLCITRLSSFFISLRLILCQI